MTVVVSRKTENESKIWAYMCTHEDRDITECWLCRANVKFFDNCGGNY